MRPPLPPIAVLERAPTNSGAEIELRIALLFTIGSPSAEVTAEELLEDLDALANEPRRTEAGR